MTFNHSVSNLPFSGLTHLIFCIKSNFENSLNNLPINIELIQLPKNYKNKILNIPKKLKVIKCSEKYNYIDDFIGINVIKYHDTDIFI